MFTGLIQQKGTVVAVEREGESGRLRVRTLAWPDPVGLGESIAVDGVCLTLVEETPDTTLAFDVLEETFRRTTLGGYQPGKIINLERALRAGDRLGGHIVNGHIDGIGVVTDVTPEGRDTRWTIRCDDALLAGIVYKGCIACNGISLTVAGMGEGTFDVCIIPETLRATSLGESGPGDAVNLEIDIVGKYVRDALEEGVIPNAPGWDDLRRYGWRGPGGE